MIIAHGQGGAIVKGLARLVVATVLLVGISGARIEGRSEAAPCCDLGVTKKTANTESILKSKGDVVEVEYTLKNKCDQSVYVRVVSETNSFPIQSTTPPMLSPSYIQIKPGLASDTVTVKIRYIMPSCVDGKLVTFRMKFQAWKSVPPTGRSTAEPCATYIAAFDVTCKSCIIPKWQDLKDTWPSCASPGQTLTDTWKFENVSTNACAGIVYTFTNLDEPDTLRAEFPKTLTIANPNDPKEIKIKLATGSNEPQNNAYRWAWKCDGFNNETGDLVSTFTVRKSIPACAVFELTKKPKIPDEYSYSSADLKWEFKNVSEGEIAIIATQKTEGLEVVCPTTKVGAGQSFVITTKYATYDKPNLQPKHAFTLKATSQAGFFEKAYEFDVSLGCAQIYANQLITLPDTVEAGGLKYVIYQIKNSCPQGSMKVYLGEEHYFSTTPPGGKIGNIKFIGNNPLGPGETATLVMTASIPYGALKGVDYHFKVNLLLIGFGPIPLLFSVKSKL